MFNYDWLILHEMKELKHLVWKFYRPENDQSGHFNTATWSTSKKYEIKNKSLKKLSHNH
jgi:hypothetical protein